ncbi:hypothetical protein SDC9_153685 [bioreactor metagenome]|uniref:Uncharacterized protein n=1 Tax=bioreactor metagenome TaxID=1076179 RepID=A0A645EZ16_9ZZZZ
MAAPAEYADELRSTWDSATEQEQEKILEMLTCLASLSGSVHTS